MLIALDEWNVHVIDGIDGNQQKELFKQSRLISNNVLTNGVQEQSDLHSAICTAGAYACN